MAVVGELELEGILAGADVVLVGAALGVEAGVQVRSHLEQVEDDDLFRQEVVELEDQLPALVSGESLLRVEVGVVGTGVHAGVGASAAGHGHTLLVQQQRQAVLEGLLHGRVVRLYLPAEKRGAVVCQMEEVAHLFFQNAKVRF